MRTLRGRSATSPAAAIPTAQARRGAATPGAPFPPGRAATSLAVTIPMAQARRRLSVFTRPFSTRLGDAGPPDRGRGKGAPPGPRPARRPQRLQDGPRVGAMDGEPPLLSPAGARLAQPAAPPRASVLRRKSPLARLDARQGARADPRQGAGGAGRVDPRPPDPGLRHSQDRLPIVAGFRAPSSARRGVPGGRQGCLPKTLNVICRSASRAGSCRNRQASSGTGALVAEAAWTRSRP